MPKKLIHRTVVISFLVFGVKTSLYARQIEMYNFQSIAMQYDENAKKRFDSLKKLVKDAQGLSDTERLFRVNDFFNQVPYSSDEKVWGDRDYWATPLEMLGKGKADCEDYAIAKFFTLLEMGIPEEKLFLTYVVTDNLTTRHMVLAYYEYKGAVPLILDNRAFTIVPETLNKNYIPLYRFNLNDFIAYEDGLEHKSSIATKKLHKWEELTKRFTKVMS